MIEEFVYTSDNIDDLKKYRVMKILFLLLGCLVLLLQSISWLIVWWKDVPVDTTNRVFVTITLFSTFSYVFSQSVYLIRNKRIVKEIADNGSTTIKRVKLRFSDKSTFTGALVILFRTIAVLFVIFLGIVIVSFIKNYLYWGKVILKMPLMVLLTVQALGLSAEFRYQALLEKKK